MSLQATDHPSDHVIVFEASQGVGPGKLRACWEDCRLLDVAVWLGIKNHLESRERSVSGKVGRRF